MYTHYSLFGPNHELIEEFEPLPGGGLPALLGDLRDRALPDAPNHCIGVGDGTLHPGGHQVSFRIQVRGETRFLLILFDRDALHAQSAELAAEGNASADKAAAALTG